MSRKPIGLVVEIIVPIMLFAIIASIRSSIVVDDVSCSILLFLVIFVMIASLRSSTTNKHNFQIIASSLCKALIRSILMI